MSIGAVKRRILLAVDSGSLARELMGVGVERLRLASSMTEVVSAHLAFLFSNVAGGVAVGAIEIVRHDDAEKDQSG